jgi:hypothetical protein
MAGFFVPVGAGIGNTLPELLGTKIAFYDT